MRKENQAGFVLIALNHLHHQSAGVRNAQNFTSKHAKGWKIEGLSLDCVLHVGWLRMTKIRDYALIARWIKQKDGHY
jgi:hypothetical protein